jgi:hypothetical protein
LLKSLTHSVVTAGAKIKAPGQSGAFVFGLERLISCMYWLHAGRKCHVGQRYVAGGLIPASPFKKTTWIMAVRH